MYRHSAVLISLGATLLGYLYSPHVAALSSDPQQPIEIEANSMTLDELSGTSVFTGQVKFVQGSIQVQAAQIIIYTKNDALDRMSMQGQQGQPATFRQLTDTGTQARGQAVQMEYFVNKSRLILRQAAELQQGENLIRSERIDYNTANNTVIAGKPQDTNGQDTQGGGQERVKIIITPQ